MELISAPLLSKISTTPTCPLWQAKCNGVWKNW